MQSSRRGCALQFSATSRSGWSATLPIQTNAAGVGAPGRHHYNKREAFDNPHKHPVENAISELGL